MLLLFTILNLGITHGEDCYPCSCESETMDCTGVQYIPPNLYYRMIAMQRIVMPSVLIDSTMVQLGVTLQPIDTYECIYICTIPHVKSTCSCDVSNSYYVSQTFNEQYIETNIINYPTDICIYVLNIYILNNITVNRLSLIVHNSMSCEGRKVSF
jgi:hypothetical protein